MILTKPSCFNAVYTRRETSGPWTSFCAGKDNVNDWLDFINPDIVINLAGQNIVDAVEKDPEQFIHVNVELPVQLAKWCEKNKKYLIQVSTQGIFSGENPEYTPESKPHPVTFYGKQKALAERLVGFYDRVFIARLTFVIGVRPFQNIGRKNPLESMMEQDNQKQVDDRFFSPVFAEDAARVLWQMAMSIKDLTNKITHVGNPISCSRYSLIQDLIAASDNDLQISVEPVSYTYYNADVARPKDTTWKKDTCVYLTEYMDGLKKCYLEWKNINNELRNSRS